MTLILGVDGCKGGWCTVPIRVTGDGISISGPVIHPTFPNLLKSPANFIFIDMPIGLLDEPGQRECDTAARRLLGRPRGSSVFPPPSRHALCHATYKEASDANFQATGKRLSQQTFGITPKIAEIDAVMTPTHQKRVMEVHPEVCFYAITGRPMTHRKSRTAGIHERWALLTGVIPGLPASPTLAVATRRICAMDDYIDALVAAWTGVCYARGNAIRIPSDNPPEDKNGLRMEMWLPAIQQAN